MIPVAFFQTRDWKYLIIPAVVFGPFFLAAGRSAVFWDVSGERTEHPFKYRGISLGSLWRRSHGGDPPISVDIYSAILIGGTAIVVALIFWRPIGLLEDMTLFITTVFVLSPKLHCGYFALLALTMPPLLRKYRITVPYLIFGLFVLVADILKSPLSRYWDAFLVLVVGFVFLIAATVWMRFSKSRKVYESV
jgi:hypothetical protein